MTTLGLVTIPPQIVASCPHDLCKYLKELVEPGGGIERPTFALRRTRSARKLLF